MKNEMDILKMNVSQKICWPKANRIILRVVGMVWLGMIIQQVLAGNQAWFMIAMVPIFALLRVGFYQYYKKNYAVTGTIDLQ